MPMINPSWSRRTQTAPWKRNTHLLLTDLLQWNSESTKTRLKKSSFGNLTELKIKMISPSFLALRGLSLPNYWGVILTSNLSWTPHINNILNICCQRFYLLNRLKHMSLCNTGLNLMFRSLVVSRLIYALPAFSGLVQQADRDRINALLRKGKRWGLTQEDLDYDLLTTIADSSLRGKIDDNRIACTIYSPRKT